MLAAIVGVGVGSLGGCNTGDVPEGRDAQAEALDATKQLNERQIALEQSVRESQSGQRDPAAVRESLKQLIWKGSAPDQLRVRALELLLSDTRPEMLADTRNMMRLKLPTESSWALLGAMADACVRNASDPAWKEMTAGMVRSYARRVPVPTDDQRPEKRALEALHPGQNVETIAYQVFLKPVENGATTKIPDWAEKSRQAAWELLSRLDPDGSKRSALLAADASGDAAVRDLSRCARELGVVPVTGSELAWLRRLIDEKNPTNAAWWKQTSAVVMSLSQQQREGLQLRHLEAVRWASIAAPEALRMSREELLSTLSQEFGGRRIWRKSEGLGNDQQISRELFEENRQALSWADAVSILAIDSALADANVRAELFKQADADRTDDGAEYGGVIQALSSGGFDARGFPPRPAQRVNDRTFVAPEEMFSSSDRALAHYHFHVQTKSNAEYAGPGPGDLEYAKTHGRGCVVFTSVNGSTLNADYYQPDGTAIDLGEVQR